MVLVYLVLSLTLSLLVMSHKLHKATLYTNNKKQIKKPELCIILHAPGLRSPPFASKNIIMTH